MKQSLSLLSIITLLVLTLGAYNSFFIVNESEQVVITQFGKPIRESVTEAGLYFKIPFVQKTHYFEKRLLKWDGEPNEIPTKDKKYIWLDTIARWRINDPLLFMKSMNNTSKAASRLGDLINGSVRDFVTDNDLVEIIRSSDWNKKYTLTTETARKMESVKVGRDKFSEIVLKSVSSVSRDFGIEILDVLVKRVNYTTKVREKVYARMISERQRIAERKRSEGEALKAEILGNMERQLKNISSEAYRKAEKIKGEADGQATKIYGRAYNKDPEFYAFLITLESYEKVMGANTKLVIRSDSPLFKYLSNFDK